MMKMATAFVLFISFPCIAQTMKAAKKEGNDFGKQESKKALDNSKHISQNDLLPKNLHGKTFDPDQAKHSIKNQKTFKSEPLSFILSEEVQRNQRNNKGFHENELFLLKSEEIANGKKDLMLTVDENIETTLHKCKQSGDSAVITLMRKLQVEVIHQPEVKKEYKICKGHEEKEKYFWESDAKKAVKKYEKKLSKDPTIKAYEVDYKGSVVKDYIVKIKWIHHHNTERCTHYKIKEKVIEEESWKEEKDQWIYDNPDLFSLTKGPDCVLIEQTCLDAESSRNIKGKKVERKCWEEKLSYLYKFPTIKECLSLKNKHCEQVHQKCLQESPFGCAVWELTFKCFSKSKKTNKYSNEDIYGLNEEEWDSTYTPNHSFSEVAMKLSVFEEIKKKLEQTNTLDASKLSVFEGSKMQCSKSVANHILYDCCFTYSGLAKKVGLSKCSSNEIALGEMREKELCHYVGSYEEKMLDLWKSRDEHVFCCFPTKLSRVVQEKGRQQLGKGWGSPKHPKCGGLTFEEVSKLDFSKMDLSEAFDQLPQHKPEQFEQKLTAFQNRIENDLKKEGEIYTSSENFPEQYNQKQMEFQKRVQEDLKDKK